MRSLLFSLLLFAVLTIPVVFSSTTSFPDTELHMYSDAIEYVYAQGIISGYPDGWFRPQNLINRAESGFQLDSGASLGMAYEGNVIFTPGRNLLTTVEFY